jgi:hypothetical protein
MKKKMKMKNKRRRVVTTFDEAEMKTEEGRRRKNMSFRERNRFSLSLIPFLSLLPDPLSLFPFFCFFFFLFTHIYRASKTNNYFTKIPPIRVKW